MCGMNVFGGRGPERESTAAVDSFGTATTGSSGSGNGRQLTPAEGSAPRRLQVSQALAVIEH